MSFTTVTLFYDGQCSFCIRSLNVLKRFDLFERISLIDANDPRLIDRFPQLAGIDLSVAMGALANGQTFVGFDAFRVALWSSPILAFIAWTWYLPGVPWLGRRIYAWVASRRREFGCASGVCEVPNRKV